MQAIFRDLQRYVGFGEADQALLQKLHPGLVAGFPEIAEVFYERVLEHDEARQALSRGEKHVGQLKGTLVKWMNELFQGPWDEAYVERRARIGRVHVQIALPQHYMVTAMNVVRLEFRRRLSALVDERSDDGQRAWLAIERACDIDLALMLHTYRQDLEARQARAERLATFGQLVGSIGHELRNPLGVIETSLYLLKGKTADERTVKHLDRIAGQVTLANDIITQLLDLIRERPLQRAPVDLVALITDVLASVKHPADVRLAARGLPERCAVSGDAVALRQVMTNLVQNAVDAVGERGAVEVKMDRAGGAIEVTVDDSGPGIDPSIRSRLFEPLVTTKPKGIGLGLALVRRIVERHGGTVDVTRGGLGGAQFVVRLMEGQS